MDLTLPRLFLPRALLAWLAPNCRPAAPDADAPAPPTLHDDLGLPPQHDAPPDAQALRHRMDMRIGL